MSPIADVSGVHKLIDMIAHRLDHQDKCVDELKGHVLELRGAVSFGKWAVGLVVGAGFAIHELLHNFHR